MYGDGCADHRASADAGRDVDVPVSGDDVWHLAHDEKTQSRARGRSCVVPARALVEDLRQQIGKKLEQCLSEIGYVNAGTVEFLMDDEAAAYGRLWPRVT